MLDLTRVAIRSLSKRRLRNLLTALAIVVGVTLVIGLNVAFQSAFTQFHSTLYEAAGSIDIVIRSTKRPFRETKLDPIRGVAGVEQVSYRVIQKMNASFPGYRESLAYVVGISPNDFDFYDTTYTQIEGSRDLRQHKVCVVEEGMGDPDFGNFVHIFTYRDSKKKGVRVDRVDHTYSVVGILSEREISISTQELCTVYLDIDVARDLFNQGIRYLPYEYGEDEIDFAVVKLKDIEDGPRLAKEIKSILGKGFAVTALKESLLAKYTASIRGFREGLRFTQLVSLILIAIISFNTSYMNVKDRSYEIGVLRSLGASNLQVFWNFFSETVIIGLVGSIGGILAGIFVGRIFLEQYIEPILHVAVAYSIDPGTLFTGLQIGLVASGIGGFIPSANACRVHPVKALYSHHSPRGWSSPRLFIFGSTLIAVSQYRNLPLSLPILDSLIQEQTMSLCLVTLLVVGMVCVFVSLIRRLEKPMSFLAKILLGSPGAISSKNVGRNAPRTVVCLLLISMCLCFLVAITGIRSGVTKGTSTALGSFLGADIIIGSEGGFDRKFAQEIRNFGGDIESATPIYTEAEVFYNSGDLRRYSDDGTLMLIEPEFLGVANLQFTEDTPDDVVNRLFEEPRRCVITQSLASVLQLEIGRNIAIMVPETLYDETARPYLEMVPEKLQVWGIVENLPFQYFSFTGSPLDKICITPYDSWGPLHPVYNENNGLITEDTSTEQTLSTIILIKTRLGADLEPIREGIQEVYDDVYDIEKILTRDDLAKEYSKDIRSIFDVFETTLSFSLLITVIGMSEILVMNVTERKRETGIFQSLGMSKLSIVAIILEEAVFLGLSGFLIGYIGGYLCWKEIVTAMNMQGFPMPLIVDLEILKHIFIVSISVSVVSSIYPSIMILRSPPAVSIRDQK